MAKLYEIKALLSTSVFVAMAALTLSQINIVNAKNKDRSPLTAPITNPVVCLKNGQAAFSWKPVEGAVKYIVRVNKEPFNIWNPADKSSGDFARTAGKPSLVARILSSTLYKWNVQALPPGLDYAPDGAMSPWSIFECK